MNWLSVKVKWRRWSSPSTNLRWCIKDLGRWCTQLCANDVRVHSQAEIASLEAGPLRDARDDRGVVTDVSEVSLATGLHTFAVRCTNGSALSNAQKLARLRADRDDFEESKAAIESFKKVRCYRFNAVALRDSLPLHRGCARPGAGQVRAKCV
jgi:hypothetical protein